MPCPMTEPIDRWLLTIFTVLVFLPSFAVHDAAESQLICSHEPIEALAGDDVILPCHLEPPISASSETVVWTKPGLDPKHIHVHQDGRLVYQSQNPSYHKRTRLFVDELMNGNVSLKIFKVKISDEGKYFCIIDSKQKEASINLSVGAVSTPIIKLVSNNRAEVVLQCESAGWYPEPEVFWLDGEGNLLSAGPTETVRGPDDLYTVSSRVTVEKRHNKNVTCRVHQKNINQTRETHIHVRADVFVELNIVNQCSLICVLLSLIMRREFHLSLNWFRSIIIVIAISALVSMIIYYDSYKNSVQWIWWITCSFYMAAILINISTLIKSYGFLKGHRSFYFAWIVFVSLVTVSLTSTILLIANYHIYKSVQWIYWTSIVLNIINLVLVIFTLIMNFCFSSNGLSRGISAVIDFGSLVSVFTLIIYYHLYKKSLPLIWRIIIVFYFAAILITIVTLIMNCIKRYRRTVMGENVMTDLTELPRVTKKQKEPENMGTIGKVGESADHQEEDSTVNILDDQEETELTNKIREAQRPQGNKTDIISI